MEDEEVSQTRTRALLLLFSIILSNTVAAAPLVELTINNVGASDTKTYSEADSINAQGGNITTLNLSAELQHTGWVGFYGLVYQNIALRGSKGLFYDWGSQTSLNGYIIVSPSESINWSELQAASVQTKEIEDQAMGLGINGVNATFINNNNDQDIIIGTQTILTGSTPTVYTYNSTGQGVWQTSLLEADQEIVYVGITQEGMDSYRGTSIDFQILVPVNTTSNIREYYFYAALE